MTRSPSNEPFPLLAKEFMKQLGEGIGSFESLEHRVDVADMLASPIEAQKRKYEDSESGSGKTTAGPTRKKEKGM